MNCLSTTYPPRLPFPQVLTLIVWPRVSINRLLPTSPIPQSPKVQPCCMPLPSSFYNRWQQIPVMIIKKKEEKISTFVVWMSFLSDSSLIKLSYTAFLTGIFLKSIDKFNEDGENQISLDSKANMKPLLEGNWDNLWLHLQLCLHLVCFNKKECKVANLLPLVYWLANLKIYFGWFC